MSVTNRDDGFQIADVSTSLLEDPKLRTLFHRLHDEAEFNAASMVYVATLLASWREGRRLTAEDGRSWAEPTPPRLAVLREVGLLDAKGRIPATAWERWFRPAYERREAKRAAGRATADKRWHSSANSSATTELEESGSSVLPVSPTVLTTVSPSNRPPAKRARAKGRSTTNPRAETVKSLLPVPEHVAPNGTQPVASLEAQQELEDNLDANERLYSDPNTPDVVRLAAARALRAAGRLAEERVSA